MRVGKLAHKLPHPLTHSLALLHIHSLTHSLTHTHPLTHSPTHTHTHTHTHSRTHSLTHSLIHSLARSLTHSLTHSLTYSLLLTTECVCSTVCYTVLVKHHRPELPVYSFDSNVVVSCPTTECCHAGYKAWRGHCSALQPPVAGPSSGCSAHCSGGQAPSLAPRGFRLWVLNSLLALWHQVGSSILLGPKMRPIAPNSSSLLFSHHLRTLFVLPDRESLYSCGWA